MSFFDVVIKQADIALERVFNEGLTKMDNSKEFDHKDGVIIGLFESIIGHAITISKLIKDNNTASLDTVLRTLFENYVYLTYVLDKDTDKRSKAYLYGSKVDEYLLYEKITAPTEVGNKIREFIGLDLNDFEGKYSVGGTSKEKAEQLYLEELGMSSLKQKWYNLYPELKLRSLEELCRYLNLEVEYQIVYDILSKEVHGKDALRRLDLKKNFVGVKKSKHDNTKLHEIVIGRFLMEIIRKVYSYYGLTNHLNSFNTIIKINYKLSKK